MCTYVHVNEKMCVSLCSLRGGVCPQHSHPDPKHFVQITLRALDLKSPKARAISVSHLISSLPGGGNVSPLAPWGAGGDASPGGSNEKGGEQSPV